MRFVASIVVCANTSAQVTVNSLSGSITGETTRTEKE